MAIRTYDVYLHSDLIDNYYHEVEPIGQIMVDDNAGDPHDVIEIGDNVWASDNGYDVDDINVDLRLHPIMGDFNPLAWKAVVEEETYYLGMFPEYADAKRYAERLFEGKPFTMLQPEQVEL